LTSSLVQIIDACVLINLLASDHIEAVLRMSASNSLICSAVEAESVYLRSGDPKTKPEKIDLQPLIGSGLLTLCSLEGAVETELYVDYASALDDGEAMSLVIALSRGFVFATDDRKARRLFLEAAGDPKLLKSTSELLRRWAEGQEIERDALKAALLRVEDRARYQPPTSDVNYQWWLDATTTSR